MGNKRFSIPFIIVVIILSLSLLFTNCGQMKASSSKSEATKLAHSIDAPVEISSVKTYEVLNVRQYLESFMNLLELKRSDFTAAEFAKILAETKIRNPLLPAKNDINSLNEVAILSQMSLAGTVCDSYISKKGASSPYFAKTIAFDQTYEKIPIDLWLKAWTTMFEDIHGRAPSKNDISLISNFLSINAEEYKVAATKDSSFTKNTGVMLCTSVLASLEGASF